MSTFLALVRLMRPHPWAIPLLVVLSLAGTVAEGVGIGLLVPLLGAALGSGPYSSSQYLARAQEWLGVGASGVIAGLLAIACLIALKTVVLAIGAAVATRINGFVTHNVRLALTRRLLDMDYGHFAGLEQGRAMNVLDMQTYRISDALTFVTSGISAACAVAAFTVMLFVFSWQLTITVVLIVVPISLLVRYLAGRAQRHGTRLLEEHSVLLGRTIDIVGAMRTIRLFAREEHEYDRMAQASDDVRRSFVRSETITAMTPVISEFLYLPVFAAVFVVALQLQLGVPALVAYLVLLYRGQLPIRRLDHARVSLGSYAATVSEVVSFLDGRGMPPALSGQQALDGPVQSIEFDAVSFQYQGGNVPAVRDVSFSVQRGEVLAIAGRSGAGKSTLVNLLYRLYEPDAGCVRINGKDLRDLEVRSWRRHLAFAGQDAELLSGTVAENIAYGGEGASEADIRAAAAMAHADEFIERLPDGYRTRIGPRGTRLSGGQRQRIALARAFLGRPDVLVLDEATNALDGMTEALVQETLDRFAGDTTVIVIAHRLATLQRARRVVVMAGGRVVGQGSPDEVLRQGDVGLQADPHPDHRAPCE